MSLKIVPPFDWVARVSDSVDGNTDKLSLKRLRNIVAGRDTTFPRSRAMFFLQATDFPNKHRDFEAVLRDENETAEIRYLAAIYLGKIATPAATAILVENSHVCDEHVLAGVMKALGRIGDESALEAISEVNRRTNGPAATQAEFAATLIAHRLGLKECGSTGPHARNHLDVDLHCARPFRINRADHADTELCLRSLADQPFGIEFSERSTYQVRCGRNASMILFNRDFVDESGVDGLASRKAFLGVVANRSEESRSYSIEYLILTSPIKQKNGVDILLHRTNGKLAFGGSGQVSGNCLAFSIAAVSQAGAFGVKIEGTFADGRLSMESALAERSIQVKKRVPAADPTGHAGRGVGVEAG